MSFDFLMVRVLHVPLHGDALPLSLEAVRPSVIRRWHILCLTFVSSS